MADPIVVQVDADLEDLIPAFLDNRQKDVATLRRLLQEQNWEGVRALGHSLKGIGGGYGFETITEVGAALEQAAREKDASRIQELVDRLQDYLSRVQVVFVEGNEA